MTQSGWWLATVRPYRAQAGVCRALAAHRIDWVKDLLPADFHPGLPRALDRKAGSGAAP